MFSCVLDTSFPQWAAGLQQHSFQALLDICCLEAA